MGYDGNSCRKECSQIGDTHFSLQSGGWCACGTQDDFGKKEVYAQVGDEECGQLAEQFAGYRGGGRWRNAVYLVGQATVVITVKAWVGCYVDDRDRMFNR